MYDITVFAKVGQQVNYSEQVCCVNVQNLNANVIWNPI